MELTLNKTPFLGKIKFKFEKFPHYSGGGSVLNKVYLNLRFTQFVSRMYPFVHDPSGWMVDPKKRQLIELYTNGKIGTHYFGNAANPKEHCLYNSFVHKNGTYIGDIDRAWWYYKNNMIVTDKKPSGVCIALKRRLNIIEIENLAFDVDIEQIRNTFPIKGYYGYTHRGGNTFKMGDKVFDQKWIPSNSEVELSWVRRYCKSLGLVLPKTQKQAEKFVYSHGIEKELCDFIPFNKRGSKVIDKWDDAEQAAINISRYLG